MHRRIPLHRKELAMCRTILLAFALLALTAFASASAAPAPAPGGCPPALDLLAPVASPAATPVCAAAAAPAPAPQPSFMTATVYHGFCRCTCSRIPDCNTNADCSNGRCLGGISCC
jgi:hypothetical protein